MIAATTQTEWAENRPTRGLRGVDLRELWDYRELVAFLALRDVKLRYKQTAFGVAWAVLQPLAGMAVFTVVFRRLAGVSSDGLLYIVFAFAGYSAWGYVSTGVTKAPSEVWSLRDVSLEIDEGETVGIIGRNGAGKSTLLKLLTRITEPTSGVTRTRGRVGALLEVGTGFHPELTGRENVYLNGAILGMRHREIDRLFDGIVDFAGVHRFLDTPVKRYSSGMYLRLAFAVAAHLEPDIMVVDEVLAVGDAEFQRKCLGKMAEVGNAGRTVLFVSHNLEAVGRLCGRVVWLDAGEVKADGPAREVIAEYLGADVDREAVRTFEDDPEAPVVLRAVRVLDGDGRPDSIVDRDRPFTVEVHFDIRDAVPGLDCAVYLTTLRGVRVVDEAWSDSTAAPPSPGPYVARLDVPPILNAGDYAVGVWFGSAYEHLRWDDQALVVHLDGATHGRGDRVVQAGLVLDVRKVEAHA